MDVPQIIIKKVPQNISRVESQGNVLILACSLLFFDELYGPVLLPTLKECGLLRTDGVI